MATGQEKQAKQDARDVARITVTEGQQRLKTEVARAATAFAGRRLRAAGDLSRYIIGGFSDDPVERAKQEAAAAAAAAAAGLKGGPKQKPAQNPGSGAQKIPSALVPPTQKPVSYVPPSGYLGSEARLMPGATAPADAKTPAPSEYLGSEARQMPGTTAAANAITPAPSQYLGSENRTMPGATAPASAPPSGYVGSESRNMVAPTPAPKAPVTAKPAGVARQTAAQRQHAQQLAAAAAARKKAAAAAAAKAKPSTDPRFSGYTSGGA